MDLTQKRGKSLRIIILTEVNMDIQNTMNNACQGFAKFTSQAATATVSTAQWVGRSVMVVGQTIASYAQKVAQFVKPYFETAGRFVVQNKGYFIVGALGLVAGAVAHVLFRNTVCAQSATCTATASSEVLPELTQTTATV